MDIRILGPLELRDDAGRPVDLGSPKQRAVLALLALDPGRVVPIDRIAFELWGDDVPRTAGNTIQAYVSRLRAAIGADVIVTRAPGYVLDVKPEIVDANRFEELAAQARDFLDDGDPQRATDRLDEALALWRGHALADVQTIAACDQEAVRLEDGRMRANEDRLEADLALGDHGSVVGATPRLIALYPLRERLYAHRMLALYRAGRQADALATYDEVRRLLDELGLEPGPDLQRLQRSILQQLPDLDWTPHQPRTPSSPPPSQIPEPVTSFIGRSRELQDVHELVAVSRLLTLTGAGGCGKTRLAIEHARRDDASAWFVPLTALTEPSLLAQHVAESLGETPGSDAVATLAARLRPHPGLLILDNCEHLVGACASLAHALLSACGSLRVLATSREPLRVTGEVVYRVPPLPLPVPGHADIDVLDVASCRLFVDRARAVDRDLVPERYREAIAESCRSLDGIPLAIELAAARCDVLTPREIAERVGGALDLLTTGSITDEAHHRTLRATLEWSYETLTDGQRRLLRALGVFGGGFTVADVEAVCGTRVLDDLSRLVSLSLVETNDEGGRKRMSLLETVRQFCVELLDAAGEATDVRRRHLAHFAEIALDAREPLAGPGARGVADALEPQLPNLRVALAFAITENADAPTGLRMATALSAFWRMRGHAAEGRSWLDAALERSEGSEPDRLEAIIQAASLRYAEGDLLGARRQYVEALDLARASGDRSRQARVLVDLARADHFLGDPTGAEHEIRLAIDVARDIGNREALMHATAVLAATKLRDEATSARGLYEQVVEMAEELAKPRTQVQALTVLAEMDRIEGKLDSSRTSFDTALDISRRNGDLDLACAAMSGLGGVCALEGDFVGAREMQLEALALARRIGHEAEIANNLTNLGNDLLRTRDLDEARDRYLETREIYERMGIRLAAAGIDLNLARVFLLKGDYRRAMRLHRKGLEVYAELANPLDLAPCLEQAGELADVQGEHELAGCLFGAGQRLRRESGAPSRVDLAGEDYLARLDLVEIDREDAVRLALDWLDRASRYVPAPAAQSS